MSLDPRISRETAVEASVPAAPADVKPGLYWLALGVLCAVGVLTRLLWLADKPLHHDESLFAYYAHFLYKGLGYDYQPILHGPVLQNVSALIFLLFGDDKFTMRLPALLGGLGLLLVAWYWRRYLGRWGVLAALAFIVLSPSLAYYSRFLRNDVPYLAVTMWCGLAVVRALHTGERRYYLWAVLSAVLMFSMMESSIFFFAACVWFLGVATVTDWVGRRDAGVPPRFPGEAIVFAPRERAGSRAGRADEMALVLGAGLLLSLAAAYVYARVFADSLRLVERLGTLLGDGIDGETRALGLLFLTLLVALTTVAWVARANYTRPRGRRGALHYFLRLGWERRWVILAAAAIGLLFYQVVFTTWFTHTSTPQFSFKARAFTGEERLLTPFQIYKNTWDYWIDQHAEHRIKGPFHYYWPLLLNYELPLVLVVLWGWGTTLLARQGRAGVLAGFLLPQALLLLGLTLGEWLCRRLLGMQLNWELLDDKAHVTEYWHLCLALFYVQMLTVGVGVMWARGRFVESFLTAWSVTSLFAYSYAGEKVPWLTVHTVGPLCLLGGLYVQRLVTSREWTRCRATRLAVVCGLAVVWQARNVAFVCFVHPHSPAERLVYNHTHPDVEYAVDRIGEIAHATNLGRQLPMVVRGEVAWPLYWYLRDYTAFTDSMSERLDETTRPVVIVNWEESMVPNLIDNYTIRRLKVREWWEPPALRLSVLSDIWRWLTPRESWIDSPDGGRFALAFMEWKKLVRYLAYREIWLDPGNMHWSNGTNEFAFCVRRDLGETYLKWETLNSLYPRRDIPTYP